MPRQAKGLTAAKVKNAKPGKYYDGRCLMLLVRSEGSKSWAFVYTAKSTGKKRTLGLGSLRQGVTLAMARERARDALELHLTGVDPLESKKGGGRHAARASAIAAPTFARMAGDYIEANRSGWAEGEAEQWEASLRDHVLPVLGAMPVADVDVSQVVKVLEPIWTSKATTARRIRSRIERILGRAAALKLRQPGPNPAQWAALKEILPRRSRADSVPQHHPMMSYAELGDFMVELRAIDSTVARALEFTIRCAARAGEVRFATWGEVDVTNRLWTIPAERMKMGVEHKIFLDGRSLEILKERFAARHGEFIFQRDGAPLGKDDLLRFLQGETGRAGATVHGFRATYRTWIDEKTSTKHEVAEISLAHGSKDRVAAAYARGEFREQRRELSNLWGAFCSMPSVRPSGDVLDFARRS